MRRSFFSFSRTGRRCARRLQLADGAGEECAMIMDEGDEMASELGFSPVVPPKSSRTEPWEYDKELYKKQNEVEQLFRKLKKFRRIFTRFDKLDIMFLGFIVFTLIVIALK